MHTLVATNLAKTIKKTKIVHDISLSVKSKKEMFREYKEIELKCSLKRNSLLGFVAEMYFKLINISVYPNIDDIFPYH